MINCAVLTMCHFPPSFQRSFVCDTRKPQVATSGFRPFPDGHISKRTVSPSLGTPQTAQSALACQTDTLGSECSRCSEGISLLFRLHPFGNNVQIQALRHGNDGAHNRFIAAIGGNVAYKRLVNFELIKRQPFEVLQG